MVCVWKNRNDRCFVDVVNELDVECRETNEVASNDTNLFYISPTTSLHHHPWTPPLAYRARNRQETPLNASSSAVPIAINAATPSEPVVSPACPPSTLMSRRKNPSRPHLPYVLRRGHLETRPQMESAQARSMFQPSWYRTPSLPLGTGRHSLTSVGKSFRSGGKESPSTTPLDFLNGQPGGMVDAWRRSFASRGSWCCSSHGQDCLFCLRRVLRADAWG